MNALKSGKVNMSQDKDVSFNVSGLDPEKAYDLYYVAQDKAGNYSARVQVITIHTLDPSAPTVVQEFTRFIRIQISGWCSVRRSRTRQPM